MIQPEGVSLGILLFPWGGILIALGVAAGALLSVYEAKRRGDDPEVVYYVFLPLAIWATLGARLWHILTPPASSIQVGLTTQYYLSHPFDLLGFWLGGYGIPGAWLGGVLALLYIARRDEIPFWEMTDLLAPAFALAQGIGRIGNYFNQELYGLPTALPWKMFVEPAHRLAGFDTVEYYHPLFAYEVILNFGNMFLLLWLGRRLTGKLKPGDLFLTYLVFYSAARFLLEFLRLDAALINGINVNQIFFVLIFALAGIRLYWLHRSTGTASSL